MSVRDIATPLYNRLYKSYGCHFIHIMEEVNHIFINSLNLYLRKKFFTDVAKIQTGIIKAFRRVADGR